jgi:hypothetical protein
MLTPQPRGGIRSSFMSLDEYEQHRVARYEYVEPKVVFPLLEKCEKHINDKG